MAAIDVTRYVVTDDFFGAPYIDDDAQWDFDGSGTYPERVELDGSASSVTFDTTHTFDRPGTYFVTAFVESHRDGDVNATSRRIPNLASARVVVN